MNLTSWVEILFIALLAFVIIGPKDLPKILFMMGRFVQSIRRLSHECMSEFEALNDIQDVEEKKKKQQKRLMD